MKLPGVCWFRPEPGRYDWHYSGAMLSGMYGIQVPIARSPRGIPCCESCYRGVVVIYTTSENIRRKAP